MISAGLIHEHKEIPGNSNLYSTTLITLNYFETFPLGFSWIEF